MGSGENLVGCVVCVKKEKVLLLWNTFGGVCLYNWVEANLVEEASFFLSCLLRKRRLGSSSYLTLVPRASSTTHTHNFFWDVFFMSSGLVRDS